MHKAIELIRREHRDIALVVQCFATVLREVREGKLVADPALFEAIIDYMQNFPDRFHHPKEEDYLFKALRERDPSAAPLLDQLGTRSITTASVASPTCAGSSTPSRRTSKRASRRSTQAATAYIDFQKHHMALEEREVLPAAEKALSDADWDGDGGAF